MSELNPRQLTQLERYISKDKLTKLRLARAVNILGGMNEELGTSYYTNGKFKTLIECTSKEIRVSRTDAKPITEFKVGMTLTVTESLSWSKKISKLTSVRHRNTLLRVAHGEIYTKERLVRFNLIDNPICPRCDGIENLAHKIQNCDYVKRIWQACTLALGEHNNGIINIKTTIGANLESTPIGLTLRAEILQRILSLKDNQTYLIRPKIFVNNSIKFLIKREGSSKVRNGLKDLLII